VVDPPWATAVLVVALRRLQPHVVLLIFLLAWRGIQDYVTLPHRAIRWNFTP
jgi:hypothetical protein